MPGTAAVHGKITLKNHVRYTCGAVLFFQSAASHCDRVGPVLETGAASLREATDQPRTHGEPVAGQGGTHSPGPSPPPVPAAKAATWSLMGRGLSLQPLPSPAAWTEGAESPRKRKKRSLLDLKSLGHGPLVAERQSLWDRLRCWKGSPHVGALALQGGGPTLQKDSHTRPRAHPRGGATAATATWKIEVRVGSEWTWQGGWGRGGADFSQVLPVESQGAGIRVEERVRPGG